jgi:hypothetical protein
MTASSAAALTGLMFVVITLATGTERRRRSRDGISTFSTPTVLHFCAALFVSATLIAPWGSLLPVALLLGVAGVYGTGYVVRVMHLTRRQTQYVADVEDWVWYVTLPIVAYLTLLVAAVGLEILPHDALFAFAASVMLLIFIGIRNSWDVVTFLAISDAGGPGPRGTPE